MHMAPKLKIVASSSSAAMTETQMGGAPPQEAPISGKDSSNGSPLLRTWRSFVLLTSSWSFEQSMWFSHWWEECGSGDPCISSPGQRDPRVCELNVSLVSSGFWDFWTRVFETRVWISTLRNIFKSSNLKLRRGFHVSLTFQLLNADLMWASHFNSWTWISCAGIRVWASALSQFSLL